MCRICRHANGGPSAINPHRLPRTVLPERYELRLIPNLEKATFDGEVVIHVNVSEPVSEIVLNAVPRTDKYPHGLVIHNATITNSDGSLFHGSVSTNEDLERATITVPGKIGKGRWQLKLTFDGVLNDKLKGFYRSTVKGLNGAPDEFLACTQFEATDARLAFPCFDEPNMKAVFQTRLVVDQDLQAISNMRAVKETLLPDGKKEVQFAPTFKMSTYLVAFVVGKLVSTAPLNVDGFEMRVWCVPGKEKLTSFALECGAFGLRYFSSYFKRSYCGDKIDLVAVPDFAAGAMENPGCITFREDTLLIDADTAAQSALDRVADVVDHELAHLWFGDLVTMGWWNGLWLNEAFATWASLKAVHAWKKHWGIWEKFGRSRSRAMSTDALGSTRPIEFTVGHPDDAKEMFDVLTYEKGASVMRMLECWLGEELFQKGIALYMDRHAFGNTEGSDLWQALAEVSGQPVADIMDGWVFKAGFPLVTVASSTVHGRGIVLRQEPFKLLPEAADAKQLWKIPLFLRAKLPGGVIREWKVLLDQRELTEFVGDGFEYVVVNAAGNSFVRVQYDVNEGPKLTAKLAQLPVTDRYNLLSDSWACVRAGRLSSAAFLDVVKHFGDETDPNVWSVILGPLASMKDVLPEGNRSAFEQVVRDLLQPVYQRLGWAAKEGETSQARELRGDILVALGETGNDAGVQAEARKVYDAWKADRKSVEPNVIDAVVSLCAHTGDAVLYNEFLQHFRAATTPQDEGRFLGSLARFRDAALIDQTLAHTLNPAAIRTQDAPFTVADLMANEQGVRAAWKFIKENWTRLVELYPESGLVRMCEAVAGFDDAELEADVRSFFNGREVKGGAKAMEQALELLRINVLFRQREAGTLAAAYPVPPTRAAAETSPEEGASVPTVDAVPVSSARSAPAQAAVEPVIVVNPSGKADGAKRPPEAGDGLKATV